jgi:hypothetical protein
VPSEERWLGSERHQASTGARWESSPVANIHFVTSQGPPYGRFRRALDNGNALAALSAASELPNVGLTDALELCLLLLDGAGAGGRVRWVRRAKPRRQAQCPVREGSWRHRAISKPKDEAPKRSAALRHGEPK